MYEIISFNEITSFVLDLHTSCSINRQSTESSRERSVDLCKLWFRYFFINLNFDCFILVYNGVFTLVLRNIYYSKEIWKQVFFLWFFWENKIQIRKVENIKYIIKKAGFFEVYCVKVTCALWSEINWQDYVTVPDFLENTCFGWSFC